MKYFRWFKARYFGSACYTFKSSSSEIYISICSEIKGARITTPQMSKIFDVEDGDFKTALIPAFAEAYRMAADASDEKLGADIVALRQLICN